MSEILNTWWFTTYTGQTIGIVKTKDDITGEIKFRTGVASGIDEKTDAEMIKKFGSRIIPEVIK